MSLFHLFHLLSYKVIEIFQGNNDFTEVALMEHRYASVVNFLMPNINLQTHNQQYDVVVQSYHL